MDTEPKTLTYQVPGGMLSNLLSQLTQLGAADKYQAVLAEIPNVRKDMGYPPLVTPLSQMVGTQAVFNIVTGERYKTIPKEIRDYLKGLYGMPPGDVNEDIRKKAIGDEQVINHRPADDIDPEFEKLKTEIGDLAESDEDVLMHALFPDIAKTFLDLRRNPMSAAEVFNINLVV